MLRVADLRVAHGDVRVLHGVTLEVGRGEIVSLVGANGAGKSTTLRAISGLLPIEHGEVVFDGAPIVGLAPAAIVARGLSQVPEGRQLFTTLTVRENLELGAYTRRARAAMGRTMAEVFALFPRLAEREHQVVGTLSGGEQQMVAIGRALMANPRLLLCDEISLGLAPIVIRDIYAALPAIQSEGVSLLLVEQDIHQALSVARRVYCFQEGRASLAGEPAALSHDDIRRAYFGI